MRYPSACKFMLARVPGSLRGGSCGDRSGFRFIDGDNPDDVRLVSVVGGDLKVFLRRDGSGDAWEPEKNLSLRDATSGMPGHQRYAGAQGELLRRRGGGSEDRLRRRRVRRAHPGGGDMAVLRGARDYGGGTQAQQEQVRRRVFPVPSARRAWRRFSSVLTK